MDGLSLDIVLQTMGRIDEKWVGRVAVAVVNGLTYLKEQFNILHRGLLSIGTLFILLFVIRCETFKYVSE